jgi:hypothetical protein
MSTADFKHPLFGFAVTHAPVVNGRKYTGWDILLWFCEWTVAIGRYN